MPPKKNTLTIRVALEPGVCHVCQCTDEEGCPEGCEWADDEHTLCSRCDDLGGRYLEWLLVMSRSD
jgi:hypothetical protein